MSLANPASALPTIALGHSDLQVSRVGLGTMAFGEQVAEADAHAILDRALALGINLIDTAEMYAVPARRETYGATEAIIGRSLPPTLAGRS